MKKMFLMAVAAIMVTMSAQAGKAVTGMRMEIGDSERDHAEYSLFTYMDDEESFGYYLSLGRVTHILGLIRDDITDASFDDIRETCICLGGTYDEAYATLSSMLDLYDKDVDTTVEYKSREAGRGDRLGDATTSTCIVKKKTLGGKQLMFLYAGGKHETHTWLPKQVVKDLRQDLKIDKKLHPKHHR
jgi:hypothetical protein